MFAKHAAHHSGPDFARSLVSGEFIPSGPEWQKEMERIEANIGRYPIGFRHYENYENYKAKFPEASIQDYTADSKYFFIIVLTFLLQ
jgi:hypothetical protein